MDGRDGMSSPGSGPYYIHRGIHGSVSGVTGAVSHPGLHLQSGFMPVTNAANISEQSNVRYNNNSLGSSGSAFPVQIPSANSAHGFNMNIDSSNIPSVEPAVEPPVEPAKKKRGRPRKQVPDHDPNMVLELTPLSSRSPAADEATTTTRKRGRPAGSGRKQQLSVLGGWMNSSAGLAFTPHVLHVAPGEDVVSKVISFSQQRSRAVCILSATGSVSSVALNQQSASSSSPNNVTFEGHFQIVCLTGSYLIAESGGPRNRTGGLSVSLCRSDGNVIGGAVGGVLVADGPVEVVLSSFVYGGLKEKEKVEAVETSKQDNSLQSKSDEISPETGTAASRKSTRNPEMDIDLMRG
ncbi:AT-hook motif nuclear-localized protein 9-like [Impatiens glandulifera]|uniref:AT-hook motif nuclear-localized protein 9-like n=1 Tax=Impatiens glandulifera TaxID=253017 RepID=UPI001FB0EAFB|nr:AT-hook motif nuclear-localized protein 9-like [Impatiens glandulifera]